MATATPTLSTDIIIIAEELSITFLAAGRVARIRACETSNEVVYASTAAERHWRRRSSTTLAELKEVATAATLAR